MAGLLWINQTYDPSSKTNLNYVNLGTIGMNSSSGISLNYTGETGFVFDKPKSDTVNLNIFFTRVSDGTIPQINYGESIFCFSIYGIE